MGNENITFLKRNGGLGSSFVIYNLKTQKFKDVAEFYGADNNDAFVNENDKQVIGYIQGRYGDRTKFVYDFDGKKISEEEEEDPIGDLDVPSLKYWQCVYCQTVITSSTQPNAKGTQCPKRPVDYLFGNPHVWQCIGDAQ
jgi:hypothetical protein